MQNYAVSRYHDLRVLHGSIRADIVMSSAIGAAAAIAEIAEFGFEKTSEDGKLHGCL
jgi:hypothetical protein